VFYEFKRIIIYFVAKVKEKTMAKKSFRLGMLVMILVFGMTVVGCPPIDDNGNNNSDGGGNTDPKTITITGLMGKTGYVSFFVFSNNALVAEGRGVISKDSVTASLERSEDENSWKGNGSYYLCILLDSMGMDGGNWFFTNNQDWTNLSPSITASSNWAQVLTALPKYNISSKVTTIGFNLFRKGLYWGDSWDGIWGMDLPPTTKPPGFGD
jgi:hypothetical protein